MTTLLVAEDVRKEYPVRKGVFQRPAGTVKAVDGVSLAIGRRATFGLVGESGSGKSTLGRLVLGLEPPTAGRILFDGQDVASLAGKRRKDWRRDVQPVFQDPYSALPPRMRVGRILEEPFRIHGIHRNPGRGGSREQAAALLAKVNLSPQLTDRYPHELSGGQRQRVVIARALALEPKLVVCDEPTSALDVSVQAHVLDLLRSLQRELGLTYLFISHDLGVIRHVSDDIGVMYLGEVVERGPADAVYRTSFHPYTRALLAAMPSLRRDRHRRPDAVKGELPSARDLPPGCKYATRCPLATDRCRQERPALREIAAGRWAACHYAEDVPERLGSGDGHGAQEVHP